MTDCDLLKEEFGAALAEGSADDDIQKIGCNVDRCNGMPLSPEEQSSSGGRFGRKKLKWQQLAAMSFLYTCVGPAALETIIHSSGSTFIAVVGCLIIPLVYAVPQIIIVSELGALMPSNHGISLWVYEAFGDFLGFYTALNFVITNIIDVAAYPTLAGNFLVAVFYKGDALSNQSAVPQRAVLTQQQNAADWHCVTNYVVSPDHPCFEFDKHANKNAEISPSTHNPNDNITIFHVFDAAQQKNFKAPFWVVYIARAAVVIVGAALSFLPANRVAQAQILIALVMVVPYVIGIGRTLPDINPRTQWNFPNSFKEVHFGTTLSGFLWLYTGWTSLGSLAGEVEKPSVLVKGMFCALGLDILVYVIPLMAALTISSDPAAWDDGHFVGVWAQIYPWLGPFLGMTVALTSMGCYMTAISCYARTLWGMAEMGMAPKVFLISSKTTGVPTVALATHVVGALCLVAIDLADIVTAEFIIASTAYLLGFFSFYQLRRKRPDVPRPFKPRGHPILYIFFQSVIMVAVAVLGIVDDWRMGIAFLGANILIVVAYFVYQCNRREATKYI